MPLAFSVGDAQVVHGDRAQCAAARALLGDRDGRRRQRHGDAVRQRGELVLDLHVNCLLG
jgi:hypothetical protein